MGNKSIQQRVEVLAAQPADPREDIYIANMIAGMSSHAAGIAAGYSEKTALALKSRKFGNARFLVKWIKACKGNEATLLPELQAMAARQVSHARRASEILERKALIETNDTAALELHERGVAVLGKLAANHERTAKIVGLIKDDKQTPQQQMVSIGAVQNLLLQVSQEGLQAQSDADNKDG